MLNQGLIFALVAIAVFMTSRILKKDDLSVEGSFGLGAAISAVIIERCHSPSLALIASLIAGALVGACTGTLFTKLKMNHLMAGLVSTTASFSLALVMASSNKIVPEDYTIFTIASFLPALVRDMIVLSFIVFFVIITIKIIVRSEVGLLLRAVGENPNILMHLGKSSTRYYLIGFMLANAITALAGSLFVQWSGFFSITGNIGVLVTGLATAIFAELLSKRLGLSIIWASLIYQGFFLLTLQFGIEPAWNNLIKALLMVVAVIAAKNIRRGLSHT
jgi:putative ABC transport system permease protein